MSKRHENGMATLLQKLIQNDPNNLYVKNPRTLQTTLLPESYFLHIIQSLVHTMFLVFSFFFFFLRSIPHFFFSSKIKTTRHNQVLWNLGLPKHPYSQEESQLFKNIIFAQLRKKLCLKATVPFLRANFFSR